MKGKGVGKNAGRGILGMLLVMVLFLCTVIPSYADEVEKITITGLTALEKTSYEVESGTSVEDAAKQLPATVTGTYTEAESQKKSAELSVTWSCEGYAAENSTDSAIDYTFRAALTAEAENSYTLAEGVTLPDVTVSVKPAAKDDSNQDENKPKSGDLKSGDQKIQNVRTGKFYDSLKEAVDEAESGDTIRLGSGTYTLYNTRADVLNKDLTFVGAGTEKTTWLIGSEVPDPDKYGTEYNSDYSFDVRSTEKKETVTFRNMTLQSGSEKYLGFSGTDHTVVEECVIKGMTFYWGYTSATFRNTTFNCPEEDYAIWTYSSPKMTFDSCTFHSTGKIINVYTDYSAGKYDITVNFNNCTVNNTDTRKKTVLKINDSNMGDYRYIINITGDNKINDDVTEDGKVSGVAANEITCSRLFGFDEDGENTGRTVVSISGTKVWENRKRVGGHDRDLAGQGGYVDGKAEGNKLQYTDGYKDDAFDYQYEINGEWVDAGDAPDDGWVNGVRKVRRVCRYCGDTREYTEKKGTTPSEEKKTEEKKTYVEPSTEQAAPIVNTTNVAVGKVWQDGDNRDGIRPASVTVQLYCNGEAYGNPVTLSEENSWWYRWDYLDAQSSWTVDELNVADGYTKTITKNAVNAWVIVNTHTPEAQIVAATDTSAAAPAQNQNLTGRGAGTGDAGNLLLWLSLMAITGAGAAGGFVLYRRRSH